MKLKKITSLILFIIPFAIFAQISLTVEINDLRNSNGHVHFELSDENKKQVAVVTQNIAANKCVIVVENLNPGRYAFKYFHDENKNKKIDLNWMMIPKEGFGFSNDPAMTFGPPSFNKTIFELNESKRIKCKTHYFK